MASESSEGSSPRSVNVLALIKSEERYVFVYDDESTDRALRIMGEYAADPELSFSWYDAAVMSQRIAQARTKHQQAIRQQAYNALRRPHQHDQ